MLNDSGELGLNWRSASGACLLCSVLGAMKPGFTVLHEKGTPPGRGPYPGRGGQTLWPAPFLIGVHRLLSATPNPIPRSLGGASGTFSDEAFSPPTSSARHHVSPKIFSRHGDSAHSVTTLLPNKIKTLRNILQFPLLHYLWNENRARTTPPHHRTPPAPARNPAPIEKQHRPLQSKPTAPESGVG